MRKVILDLAVTLDGFIEGPNGEVDWCVMDNDMKFDAFLADIDTIFYGRVSYEIWGRYQPDDTQDDIMKELFDTIHSKKKYVFSKSKKSDGRAIFIDNDIEERVLEIKHMPGKNIWLYGGASLITTFIDLGLIDTYRLSVHPIILGAGKPVFANIKNRVGLRLNEVKPYKSGVTLLSYGAV